MLVVAWENDAIVGGAAAAPDSEKRPGVDCADEIAGVELNENAAAVLVVTGGDDVGAEKLNPADAGALDACDGPREKPEVVAGVDAAEKLKPDVAAALDALPPPNKDIGAGALVDAGAAPDAAPKANDVDVGEAAGADETGIPNVGAEDAPMLNADPDDGFGAAVGVLKEGPPVGAPPNAGVAAAAEAAPKAGAGVDEAAPPPNAGVDGVPNAGAEDAAPNKGVEDAPPPNTGADDAAKAEAEGVPKAGADDPNVGAADEPPKAAADDEPNREADDDGVEKENGAEGKDMLTTKVGSAGDDDGGAAVVRRGCLNKDVQKRSTHTTNVDCNR